jgi:hypothetical protein
MEMTQGRILLFNLLCAAETITVEEKETDSQIYCLIT